MTKLPEISLTFHSLISAYKVIQDNLVKAIKALTSKGASEVHPGSFILLQFQMSQVTQMGESISNLISQVNRMISNSIANQKTQ